jgi:protein-S-isoprenylcysteine O-methyltransferase Ste14
MLLVVLVYAALLLACIRIWGSPDPWSRLDLFSAGYVVLSLTLCAQHSLFASRFRPAPEIRRLFYSLDIDPGFERWSMWLGLAELAAILDYAHWHLVPALDSTAIKTAGLILYLLTVAWLFRVDIFLFHNFAPAQRSKCLLTSGPYRLVRHPRYTGLLFTRICFALLLASPIAWCLCVLWIVLIRRRIQREERYLRIQFGAGYDLYAESTPQLIPFFRFRRYMPGR